MKKVEIEIPEGYELKKEGDTYRVVKSENKLPERWEDLFLDKCYWVGHDSGYVQACNGNNRTDWATEEQAHACVALAQLTQLLKAYNGDWKPDWTENRDKHCIKLFKEQWKSCLWLHTNHLFTFETEAKRDHFLKHHIDLLNQVKPLFGG